MRFESIIISLFLASFFLIGGIAIIDEQIDKYDTPINDKLFENVTRTNNAMYDQYNLTKSDIDLADVGSDTAEGDLYKGSFKSSLKIWGYIESANNLVRGIANAIGVPGFIIHLMFIMLGVTTVISLAYFMRGFQLK